MKRSIVGGRQHYGYKFNRQKDGIYEISFIYAQDPQKAKNAARRPSPDTAAMDLRSGFARKLRLLG